MDGNTNLHNETTRLKNQLHDMNEKYAQWLQEKQQLTNDWKISVEENIKLKIKIQKLETEKEQWGNEKKKFEIDKQLWEQQKDQPKKSLDDKNRDFEKANAELLTGISLNINYYL